MDSGSRPEYCVHSAHLSVHSAHLSVHSAHLSVHSANVSVHSASSCYLLQPEGCSESTPGSVT